MPCAIHGKPIPCPDCASAFRARAVDEELRPLELFPKPLPVVSSGQRANLKPVPKPDLDVPLNAVLPRGTRIEVVGGKRLLKCQYNILGCAGPEPWGWLAKGYKTCPECSHAPAGPRFRPSLVPVAWALTLRDIYTKKQPEFFNKDWTPKKSRQEAEGETYGYLRGLGVAKSAVTPDQFLAWFKSVTVGGAGPIPQYAHKSDKQALQALSLTQVQTDRLAGDFYWYWHTTGGSKNALARLYTNLDPASAPAVYRWVVGNIVKKDSLTLASGVKIAGPAESRTDSIVLYLLQQRYAQEAVNLIGDGIKSGQISKAAFREPLTAFTHPAVYGGVTLGGTSTGAEPPLGPNNQPVKSLGSATAECIVAALWDIKKEVDAGRHFPNGTLVFFLETTWQYMKKEGLEHSQPV